MKSRCSEIGHFRATEMEVSYLLQHTYGDGDNNTKVIGIYRSEESAKKAIERMRCLPGFSKYPQGFHIDGYSVDLDNWTSGFGIN